MTETSKTIDISKKKKQTNVLVTFQTFQNVQNIKSWRFRID